MLLVIRITLEDASGTRRNMLKKLLDEIRIILADELHLIASSRIFHCSFFLFATGSTLRVAFGEKERVYEAEDYRRG